MEIRFEILKKKTGAAIFFMLWFDHSATAFLKEKKHITSMVGKDLTATTTIYSSIFNYVAYISISKIILFHLYQINLNIL